jgi:hypothetical protein
MPSLAVVVLTYNEAAFLPDCLASAASLDADLIVLDSYSTDQSRAIATAAGATVYQRPFDGFANQRNAALELAGDKSWVLFLDADERLTPALTLEIQAAAASAPADVAAYWIPRRNIFFRREIHGGGWWPDYQARLLRPTRCRYDSAYQVHERVLIDGRERTLGQPVIHLNYSSRREFLEKQRRYTKLRVRQDLRRGWVPRRRSYLGAPAREFWRRYVQMGGYRDWLTGLFLAAAMAREEMRAVALARRHAGPDVSRP